MSAKRTYSAFLSSASSSMPANAGGFGAHEAQQQPTAFFYQSPALRIPGQWPEDASDAPTHADAAPATTSFFSTVGKWVATVANITNILALPESIAKRFLRKQTIFAVPVTDQHGSNKKRLVDAGFADQATTPSPSVRARANQSRRQNMTRTTALSPDTWCSSPRNASQLPPPRFISPLSVAPVYHGSHANVPEPIHGTEEEQDEDDSLDFSFEGVIASTPPHSKNGSPIHVPFNSPSMLSPTGNTPPQQWQNRTPEARSPFRPQSQSHIAQTPDVPSPCPKGLAASFSSSTHSARSNFKSRAVTPMRRQLVKRQLSHSRGRNQTFGEVKRQRALEEEVEHGSAEVAPISPADAIGEELTNSPNTLQTPLPTDDESPPTNLDADILSALQQTDAAGFEYENDLSFLEDAPFPSPRKMGVRWSETAGIKAFYFDERVSEMLDSTLEMINFNSPRKTSFEYEDEEDESNSEHSKSPRSAATATPGGSPNKLPANEGGFHGVPADTFDASEDSLEESQISIEFLDDLHEEIKYKLSLLPPAPPTPPPPQPLISPLGSEELNTLELAAKKTNNGLLADSWIVPDKLYARDFATLLPRMFNGDPKAWLNDNIVNEYLAILVAHKKKEASFEHKRGGPAPPVHAFSSFWYSTAKKSLDSVTRWGKRFQLTGKQYLDAELILYPICDRGHWRLMAIKPKERTIEYFDSMGLSGDAYIETAKAYLAKELGQDYVADEWTVLRKQRSSQQLNGSDCGVFTVLNALVLLRGEEADRVLPFDGMLDARERIATTLMAGCPTTEME